MRENILNFLLFVFFCIAGIGLMRWMNQRRRLFLEGYAIKKGYKYYAYDTEALMLKLKNFSLFTKGYSRHISNVIKIEARAFNLYEFDYAHDTYTPGTHYDLRKRFTSSQTVFLIEAVDFEFALLKDVICKQFSRDELKKIEFSGNTALIYSPEIKCRSDEIPTLIENTYNLLKHHTEISLPDDADGVI